MDDYTLNLYSSCSFNCLYCYIRGSKYGTNLEESLSIKPTPLRFSTDNFLTELKTTIRDYCTFICYRPLFTNREKYKMTRQALEVIAKHNFPVHIITKSDLIERDFDLLHRIDQTAILPNDLNKTLGRGVTVSFSFSTLDDAIANIFEKGATKPSLRLKVVENHFREFSYRYQLNAFIAVHFRYDRTFRTLI